jgi:hypothetical protein
VKAEILEALGVEQDAGSATVTRGIATATRANPCRYSEPKPPAARSVSLPEFKATPARIGAVAGYCGP